MATINGSCDNNAYSLKCDWTSTQNVSANTSSITAIVYIKSNGSYSTVSSNWSCVINGSTVTSGKSLTVNGSDWHELGRKSWTVSHASNGSCSTSISFSYSNGLSSAGTYTTKTGSGSGTATLPTIPRGSTITLNRSSATIGSDQITISINRASSSFTHKVQLYFGSYGALLAEGVSTSYSFTPNISLCSQIPNATSGTATIKVQTMNGNTWVAETSKTITFNVPTTVVPSVSISVSSNNALNGYDVAGKTTYTVKASGASGAYGSTIKSYLITGGGLNSTSSSATTGTLSSGKYTFTIKVTDSRGRTAIATASRTMQSYTQPTFSGTVYRTDSEGTKDDSGTYAYTTINVNIINVANANVNVKQFKIEWKLSNSTTYAVLNDWTNLNSYNGSQIILLGDGWATTSSYDIKISIKDSYTTVTNVYKINTIGCLMDFEQNGIGVSKIHERGALDVGGDIYTNKNVYVGSNVGNGVYGADGSRLISLNSSGGIDVGASDKGVTLCSNTNPKWWNGTTSYDIFNSNNCTITTGSGGGISWRFANGLQINHMQIYGTWNITTAWGSVYSSPHITPSNYCQTFLTPPQVSITAHGAGTAVMVCQAGAPTTTMPGTYYLWKPVQQTGVRDYIEITSIGRWK